MLIKIALKIGAQNRPKMSKKNVRYKFRISEKQLKLVGNDQKYLETLKNIYKYFQLTIKSTKMGQC